MLYITADTHGDTTLQKLRKAKDMENITHLIVTGDFGYVYFNTKSENELLDEINNLGYKVLFVDGNHEGFDVLNSYQEIMWNGGKVHKVRENILHLKRGEIFNIEGISIFAFGGARSLDMLEKISTGEWFEEEMPTQEEMDYGITNLEKHNYQIDYIVSHNCDEDSLKEIIPYAQEDKLNRYFMFIKKFATYKCWYFGHLHWDYNVDDKHKCLYENIIKIH